MGRSGEKETSFAKSFENLDSRTMKFLSTVWRWNVMAPNYITMQYAADARDP